MNDEIFVYFKFQIKDYSQTALDNFLTSFDDRFTTCECEIVNDPLREELVIMCSLFDNGKYLSTKKKKTLGHNFFTPSKAFTHLQITVHKGKKKQA